MFSFSLNNPRKILYKVADKQNGQSCTKGKNPERYSSNSDPLKWPKGLVLFTYLHTTRSHGKNEYEMNASHFYCFKRSPLK